MPSEVVSSDDRDVVARDIEDRGFPRGELVLASLRGRQLPVIAYAFAEFLRKRLTETAGTASAA